MTHFGTMMAAAVAFALAAGAATLMAGADPMPNSGESEPQAEEPSRPPARVPAGWFGVAADREGVVSVKQLAATGAGPRWHPLEPGLQLFVGDWVEVGTRGANAGVLELANGVSLTAGPGALVELTGLEGVTLHRGDLACRVPDGLGFSVADADPAGATAIAVSGRSVLRVPEGASIGRLDEDPRWLAGYEADATTEAMGSLLAKVDGREVPLTIGYHKVTVDVRDQLARTVVEQSFVNHTNNTLEGVFYFPLPADASISGFGMWIGGELVQGDIVEKQRAREIYETILREKRDPGLLEWTGGNLFKARVFPIGREKRIRISYTQVLPREGEGFRYRYGLQSELLRKHPVSRLSLEVNVHSERALAAVASTTHAGRATSTEHSARYEFTAEEYTPTSDFELAIDLEPAAERLTIVPHRRGDDGYFMLLVDAPESNAAAEERTEPLDLLILADTSGSMWGPQRAAQIAFIEALVGALDPADTFDLATCDTETRWAFGGPTAAGHRPLQRALEHLEAREPLGWSDLEGAFEQAFTRAAAGTQVVYIGDGNPTSGAADPVAFARWLEEHYPARGSFHAVVPGSSSEPAALRAIASLGGGSVRQIGAGADALQTAHGLLDELTAPTIKNLQLDFGGLPVAAVYPERLSNLPAGGQHVVVGRFDGRGGDLAGVVAMTGTVGGRAFRQQLAVSMPGDDEGNSFVPRLWARRHLDHLLDQGSSPEVVERIAEMSADYQIVTPYTSFLVLESEADRERFSVPKSFRMRDGEEFFLEGREAGAHDLTRAQMQAAEGWRRQLREAARKRLAGMGRDLTALLDAPYLPIPASNQVVAVGGAAGGSFGTRMRSQVSSYRGAGDTVAPAQYDEREEAFYDGLEQLGYTDGADVSNELVEEDALAKSEPSSNFAAGREMLARRSSPASPGPSMGGRADYVVRRPSPQRPIWDQIFPRVPLPTEPTETLWSEEARGLLEGLDRHSLLAGGGWRLRYSTQREGTKWASDSELVTASTGWWFTGARRASNAYAVHWFDGERRGVFTEGWRLGRARAAEPGDALGFGLPLRWYLQRVNVDQYTTALEPLTDDRVSIEFVVPAHPDSKLVVQLDRSRGVVTEEAWWSGDRVTQRWTYADFSVVGGAWWPGQLRQEIFGASGPEQVILHTLEVERLSEAAAGSRLEAERADRDDVIVLGTVPAVVDAKQALADGEERLEVRLAVLGHELGRQRRERALAQLDAVEVLIGARPGFERLRLLVLDGLHRNEELRRHALRLARDLVEAAGRGEYGQARDLMHSVGNTSSLEQVELLRVLLPLIERVEDDGEARRDWDLRFLRSLRSADRGADVLALSLEAAERHRSDPTFQRMHAELLARSGDLDGAIAWIDSSLEGTEFDQDQRRTLHSEALNLLWNGYRLGALARRFVQLEATDPLGLNSQACELYLVALVYLDRVEEALRQAEEWAVFAKQPEREPAQQDRLAAAVRMLKGQAQHLGGGNLDRPRLELLIDVVRALAAQRSTDYLLGSTLTDWRFRQTDESRGVLKQLLDELKVELETLPADYIQVLAGSLRTWNDEMVESAEWEQLGERLFERWRLSEDPAERPALGNSITMLAAGPVRRQFLRENLAAATTKDERAQRILALWGDLQGGDWSAEVEAEQFALFAVLDRTAGDDGYVGLPNLLVGLVDWILQKRVEAKVTGLEGYELLTRRELADARKLARTEVGANLSTSLATRAEAFEPAYMRDWMALERHWLDATDGRLANRGAVGAELLSLVESRAAALRAADPESLVVDKRALREQVLAARALTTGAHWLAVEFVRGLDVSDAGASARWLTLVERLATDGVTFPDPRALARDLLLALDRGDELEVRLRDWFGEGRRFDSLSYGIDLGLLLAERGELEAAVELFAQIEAFDELPAEMLLMLSDWHTALDQRELARAARVRAFEARGSDDLGNQLRREAQSYQRSGNEVPDELEADVPLRFIALFNKAEQPANYLWVLEEYYGATRDFRLLECLPNGVIGHSAQGIYGFLEQVSSLANSIDEEAVVDRVVAGLQAAESAELTDVDRRALGLLRFAIVLRAARQTHGTERHAERCLAALSSCFPADAGGLAEGEPHLLAQFLVRQGRLEPEALAHEQLRQLRELSVVERDPDNRLAIAGSYAEALWNYGRKDEAVRVYEAALAERREANAGSLPRVAYGALRQLSDWLAGRSSYAAAEGLWAAELGRAPTAALRLELELGRLRVVRDASIAQMTQANYVRARDELLGEIGERTNERHTREVVGYLCDLWDTAHRKQPGRISGLAEDARSFAFGVLPDVLERYNYREGQRSVQRVGDTLRGIGSQRTALEFLLARAEGEPQWLEMIGRDFWGQHGWRFASALKQAGPDLLPEELAERILAIISAELRRDMVFRQGRNRSAYDQRYNDYWRAQREAFRTVADQVVADHQNSPVVLEHVAEYLSRGLDYHGAAIDVLAGVYARGELSHSGQSTYVGYLQEAERWAESLPVAVKLTERRPADINGWAYLVHARFHTEGDLDGTFDAAEAGLRAESAWTERNIEVLATAANEAESPERAVGLLDQAIALHRRGNGSSRGGDSVLSRYYSAKARALSALGQTQAAVDAAAGAIVAWGNSRDRRRDALNGLVSVLNQAEDLDEYVTGFEAEVDRTGLENPVLRKALAQVLVQKGEHGRAAAQLESALQSEPNDLESHAALVQAYRTMKRGDLLVRSLLARARAGGHQLGLYTELGAELESAKDAAESERAYTSLVELSANESEGHAELAGVRERQGDFAASLLHWGHVIRIRTKEPTGYLGQARALIQLGRADEAQAVIDHLRSEAWPSHFGNVRSEADALEKQLSRRR